VKKVTCTIDAICVGRHTCFYECPSSAIHRDVDKYKMDQAKCIRDGSCASFCNISAVHALASNGQKLLSDHQKGPNQVGKIR